MPLNNVFSKTWTKTVNGDFVITKDYGFTIVSILASGGSVTILGGMAANGEDSEPIVLADGQALTVNGGTNETMIIDDLSISTSATAYIIAR